MLLVKSWCYRIFSCTNEKKGCEHTRLSFSLVMVRCSLTTSTCSTSARSSTKEQKPKWKGADNAKTWWYPWDDHSIPIPYPNSHSHRRITLSPWNIALQKSGWTNWCIDNQRNRTIKEDWATWAAFWSPISSYSPALPRKLNWVWAGRHPGPASTKQVHFRVWVHIYTLLSTEATETVKKDMLRKPVQPAASSRFLKDGCGLSVCLYSPILFQCISVADSSDCWNMFLKLSE